MTRWWTNDQRVWPQYPMKDSSVYGTIWAGQAQEGCCALCDRPTLRDCQAFHRWLDKEKGIYAGPPGQCGRGALDQA